VKVIHPLSPRIRAALRFDYPSTAGEAGIEGEIEREREKTHTKDWRICSTASCGKGVPLECMCRCGVGWVGGKQLMDTINVIRKPYQSIFQNTFQMEGVDGGKE
jgi:hypothetical protein